MTYLFDEENLRVKLSGIGEQSRVIFAAACATRLLPQYEEYDKKVRQNVTEENPLTEGLSELWDQLVKRGGGISDIDDVISRCEASLPDEDHVCDVGCPYAADAAAAIYYALNAYRSDSVQNAIWSARRVYEAIDNLVVNRFDIDPSTLEGEKKVLEHPIIQRELSRQDRDIEELISARNSDSEEVARRFYSRAISEAADVWTHTF